MSDTTALEAPTREVTARLGAEGYAVDIDVGPFTLRADEPQDRGGTDTGPTPHQLIASGLASCTAMTLRMYAARHAIPLESVQVTVAERRPHDAARGSIAFDVRIALPGGLDPTAREALMTVAARCPVHQTLSKGAEVTLLAGSEGDPR